MRSHFRAISLTSGVLAAAAAVMVAAGVAAASNKSIAISQIVEHPALDATRHGLIDGLRDSGYRQGDNLDVRYQTAQGNPAIAAQIARQFVGDAPDVLVGIATPSAQALAAATKSIPVVFTAVTDPVSAGLIADMERPGGNVTGLSDMSPVAQHVAMIREIMPRAQRIGVVYNPGESNAVSLVNALRAAAPAQGFSVVESAATRTSEVLDATRALTGRADIIYAPTDNTIASAIAALISAASDAGIAVFGGETSYVDAGAIAALGFDYYQIGYQTGAYVARILNGEAPGAIPARVASGSDLVVNPGVAGRLGLTLPGRFMREATRVVE